MANWPYCLQSFLYAHVCVRMCAQMHLQTEDKEGGMLLKWAVVPERLCHNKC